MRKAIEQCRDQLDEEGVLKLQECLEQVEKSVQERYESVKRATSANLKNVFTLWQLDIDVPKLVKHLHADDAFIKSELKALLDEHEGRKQAAKSATVDLTVALPGTAITVDRWLEHQYMVDDLVAAGVCRLHRLSDEEWVKYGKMGSGKTVVEQVPQFNFWNTLHVLKNYNLVNMDVTSQITPERADKLYRDWWAIQTKLIGTLSYLSFDTDKGTTRSINVDAAACQASLKPVKRTMLTSLSDYRYQRETAFLVRLKDAAADMRSEVVEVNAAQAKAEEDQAKRAKERGEATDDTL